MRILITGVSGFIGSALWNYLQTHHPSWEVFGLDQHGQAHLPRRTFFDLNQSEKTSRVLKKIRPEIIFHFAGGRMLDSRQLLETNFYSTVSLLKSVKEIPNFEPRILIPGSAAEYGHVPGVRRITERIAPHPYAWYGFAKWMQTMAALWFAKQGMDVVVGRIFNISGRGTPPQFALGRFAQEIVRLEKRRRPVVMETGPLDSCRDFLDIQDVCSAAVALARKGRRGEIYNICSGRGHRMRDLLKRMLQMSSCPAINIREGSKGLSNSFSAVGNNSKICRETGWRPEYDFQQSLRDTLEFYRRNEGNPE